MDGVLVVDKPAGPTSHDVVARARRALAVRRIGHTGTLDPLATGVLPLVMGRATRLASLLSGAEKEYVADVRFGLATPTYDADARIVYDPVTRQPTCRQPPPPAPEGLARDAIEAALGRFTGTYLQTPPAFSAKKIAGVAAYKRARRNEGVEPRPVSVTVRQIAIEDYSDGLARIRLSASAGFYVRAFAHELGRQIGCGAHLEALRRVRAGDFTLADAVSLEALEREGAGVAAHLIPLERLLPHLPEGVLTERGTRRASHGNSLTAEDFTAGHFPAAADRARLLDGSGKLLGIAEPSGNGLLHPVIVLV